MRPLITSPVRGPGDASRLPATALSRLGPPGAPFCRHLRRRLQPRPLPRQPLPAQIPRRRRRRQLHRRRLRHRRRRQPRREVRLRRPLPPHVWPRSQQDRARNAGPRSRSEPLSRPRPPRGCLPARQRPLSHTPLEEPTSIAVDNSSGPSQGDVYLANGAPIGEGELHPRPGREVRPLGPAARSWGDGGSRRLLSRPSAPIAGPFTSSPHTVDPSGNLWVSAGLTHSRQPPPEASSSSPRAVNSTAASSLPSKKTVTVTREFNSPSTPKAISTPLSMNSSSNSNPQPNRSATSPPPEGIRTSSTNPASCICHRCRSLHRRTLPRRHRPRNHTKRARCVLKRYDASCRPAIVEVNPQPGCDPAEDFGSGLVAPFSSVAIDPVPSTTPVYVADGGEARHDPYFTVFSLQPSPTSPPPSPSTPPPPPPPSPAPSTPPARTQPGDPRLPLRIRRSRPLPALRPTPTPPHTVPCDKTAAQIGEGSVPVEVQAAITGLQAGHAYHYRLVASNPNDENPTVHQPSRGADLLFGPPPIESAFALSVSSTDAVLQAEVDPEAIDTHVRLHT